MTILNYEINNSIFFRLKFQLFRTFSWSNCPRIDPDFKRSVATNMLQNLSQAK